MGLAAVNCWLVFNRVCGVRMRDLLSRLDAFLRAGDEASDDDISMSVSVRWSSDIGYLHSRGVYTEEQVVRETIQLFKDHKKGKVVNDYHHPGWAKYGDGDKYMIFAAWYGGAGIGILIDPRVMIEEKSWLNALRDILPKRDSPIWDLASWFFLHKTFEEATLKAFHEFTAPTFEEEGALEKQIQVEMRILRESSKKYKDADMRINLFLGFVNMNVYRWKSTIDPVILKLYVTFYAIADKPTWKKLGPWGLKRNSAKWTADLPTEQSDVTTKAAAYFQGDANVSLWDFSMYISKKAPNTE